MKERPILFSGAMVRAIRADLKSQTRRVCKHQHWSYSELHDVNKEGFTNCKVDRSVSCPYGSVGDRLWVRETWRSETTYDVTPPSDLHKTTPIWYEADGAHGSLVQPDGNDEKGKLRPSIFMLRWMSRITLEIVSVRVERLQEISAADAIAEGIPRATGTGMIEGETAYLMTTNSGYMRGPQGAILSFRNLWDSINAERGCDWNTNPWVWVLKFRKL